MRIYCLSCKDHILNTADAFVMGGPYTGAMFSPVHKDAWRASIWRQQSGIKDANLMCPRCEGQFIQAGRLLTEHGVVVPGQKTIDKSISIIAPPGHIMPGSVMRIVDSKEVIIDRVEIARKERQSIIDEFDQQDGPDEKFMDLIAKKNKMIIDSWIDVMAKSTFPDNAPISDEQGSGRPEDPPDYEPAKNDTDASAWLVCEKCGKRYVNSESGMPWYEKHVRNCSKKG